VTLPWIIGSACAGLIAGPPMRASVFSWSTKAGQPRRNNCPTCGQQILPNRWRWWCLLLVTGRCSCCRARVGPYPLTAELAAGSALALVAARAPLPWELAALAWLVLLAVPLAFIDMAVRRLPDTLTAAAFAGTLGLLAVAALSSHEPGNLIRAVESGAVLTCFYLILSLIRPGGLGLGDAKLAASIGIALGWTSWQALLTGTFIGLALAAVYGGVGLALHRATRASQMPLGPFILLGALVALSLSHAHTQVLSLAVAVHRAAR
jgi:leader peptidase (prepilin peptidase) / N-methyltransferase